MFAAVSSLLGMDRSESPAKPLKDEAVQPADAACNIEAASSACPGTNLPESPIPLRTEGTQQDSDNKSTELSDNENVGKSSDEDMETADELSPEKPPKKQHHITSTEQATFNNGTTAAPINDKNPNENIDPLASNTEDIDMVDTAKDIEVPNPLPNSPKAANPGNTGTEEMEPSSHPEAALGVELDPGSSSPKPTTGAEAGDGLTDAMIKEEEKMHQKTVEEETKLKEEHSKAFANLDEETRDMKYQQLQFLLQKSNMYTVYLSERMKRQQAEQEKKMQRLMKRRELKKKKDEEKRLKEEQEQKAKEEAEKSKSNEPSQPGAVSPGKATTPLTSPRSTRSSRSLQSPGSSSVGSTGSVGRRLTRGKDKTGQTDSQESQASTPGRRGRKRKAESIIEKTEESKKVKVDESQTKDSIPEGEEKLKTEGAKEQVKPATEISDTDKPKPDDTNPNAKKTNEDELKSNVVEADDSKSDSDKAKVENNDKWNEEVADEEEVDDDLDDVEMYQTTAELVAELEKVPELACEGKEIKGEKVLKGQPPLFNGGCLREYQIEGMNWLQTLYENGVNGILADEMGLGKTIQCIATIASLTARRVEGPYLVVAPLSTLPNWLSECKRFAPKLPVILYHGDKNSRTRLRKKINRRVKIGYAGLETCPIILTSYEVAMKDQKNIAHFPWKYLIVDEGHRIKNFECKLIQNLKMYRSTHRLLLTGTPLQNNLSELWSLLNFLLPEIFDDLGSFQAWFCDLEYLQSSEAAKEIVEEEERKNVLAMMHQILKPFMLRRLKTDVCLAIPPKKEVIVYAPLTTLQQQFYRTTIDRTILNVIENKNKPETPVKVELNSKGRPMRQSAKKTVDYAAMMLTEKEKEGKDDDDIEQWAKDMAESISKGIEENKSGKTKNTNAFLRIKLQNIMMQLRKVCNHPYLLEYPINPETNDFRIDEDLVKNCGKTLLLDKMLPVLKKKGHKVLIFSQMTMMLDILQDYCWLRKYKCQRLDGACNLESRQESIEEFNTDKESFIFLLSTRAGGLGINLTAADTVIIYDSDWNPQCDLQAQDRCHRLGQEKPVVVYRVVTAKTIDQRIVERAAAKRKLEKMVISKGKFRSGLQNFVPELDPLKPEELLETLRSADFESSFAGREGNVISNRDLERLLDRSDLWEQWQEKLKDKLKPGEKTKLQTKPKSRRSKSKHQDVEGVFKTIDTDMGQWSETSIIKSSDEGSS
ncbi:unnamed protein product [Owenia fusiformis]|uniref:Proliferation-associated SNF2-like protein n=1 Tax=Owenia fusiformis TaxID=6347 RepID=A0A8J1UAT6_OWEFU|nr:unnamed protein product [Owenia fusiformis]